MNDQTIRLFRRRLLSWFSKNQRRLPWRETEDPYRIWVSEAMLQQTQVKTVLPYYERFIKTFPDAKALSEASLDAVLKSWEGMGYYARARNLHRAAGILVDQWNGQVPDDYEAFRKLPGVGEYIASAVLSVAFNRPYAVLDGNVKRVLSRLFLIDAPVNRASSLSEFREHASRLLDTDRPGDFNQALMELGATICRPVQPECAGCPVASLCKAFDAGKERDFPVSVRRKSIPSYHIAVGVVHKDNRILITKRKPSGLLGGLWEFPGGKVKPGERPEESCKREIREELNLSVEVTKHVAHVKHAYTHFKVVMDVFDCTYKAGKVKLRGPDAYRWIVLEEIDAYAFPGANHKFLPILKKIHDGKNIAY